MKGLTNKINVAIVAAFMLLTAGVAYGNENDPVNKKSSEASVAPDVIRKEMNVTGYQLVKVNGNFKVYLKQGDEQKIVVEADESLVPEVKHFIVDNTLNIYTSDQVKKRITLWITLKDVNNLNKFGRVRVIKE